MSQVCPGTHESGPSSLGGYARGPRIHVGPRVASGFLAWSSPVGVLGFEGTRGPSRGSQGPRPWGPNLFFVRPGVPSHVSGPGGSRASGSEVRGWPGGSRGLGRCLEVSRDFVSRPGSRVL
ncbi:hypothetical protein DEO72_LG4g2902 [Vigna unguiculata]|uniref:Uncharacterized protein n=1 Tax=Vigna unguiculata TaxID=3917 RepID=A0A4D6LU09_VIGUN|nr:hypothetical protein DEO72_LG4g2902 [Vigna unguiculata]